MTKALVILPRAERDVRSILDWIHRRSTQGAVSWWQAFETAALRTVEAPQSRPLAPESPLLGYELRQFLFKTRYGRIYRGVFTVVGEEVRILRVRGPGQPELASDEVE